MSIATCAFLGMALRDLVGRYFLTPAIFQQDVSGHAVKVTGRITNVSFLKLRQSLYHSIDRLVCIVFRIAETLRHEDADQTGANDLVPVCCFFAVGIEPLKQSIKWVRGDGHLSANSFELVDR